MDTRDALTMARDLMDRHGLGEWTVRLDGARRRAGSCVFARRQITLSRYLVPLYTETHVREVILHEIAHALVGPAHGHDAHWRATALRIGSTGERLVDPGAPKVPAPWRGVCPSGHVAERFRRPARPVSCARCAPRFTPELLLTWTFRGEQVPMGRSYDQAVRLLQAARVGPPGVPVPRYASSHTARRRR